MSINTFDNYPLSWKPDKSKLSRPYYKSLAIDLEHQIITGILRPGTKLPPQREIADYLDLNYSSITKVYSICQKKGLIYGIIGKGTFVAAHPVTDSTLLVSDYTDTFINMGALNIFSEYSSYAENAIQAVIKRGQLHKFLEYSNSNGLPHQLAAGVRWMEQLGIHTDIQHTVIVPGSQNALTIILLSLFSSGDKIATDTYTYANFIELAKMLQITLVPIDSDENGMIPEDLYRKCQNNQIKGLYLMPSSTNPTGNLIPEQRRTQLAKIIRKEHLLLIEDDIASWLCSAQGNIIPSIHDLVPEHCVYICNISKVLCTGLRIAYLVFPDQYRKQLLHGIYNISVKSSGLDAEIITELLLNGDAFHLIKQKYRACQKASELYEKFFPHVYEQEDRPNFYKWLPIFSNKPYEKIEQDLLDRGIRIYHSSRFSVLKEQEVNYLRVSISSAGSMANLKKGLSILQKYISEFSD
ncbi:MAG: PLP-dependent aminotransferase family protein [Lachnospiraceae bacterium]|nr:PLP-dependent aminotransferase family protein [Lachnospiraceae bacterium]